MRGLRSCNTEPEKFCVLMSSALTRSCWMVHLIWHLEVLEMVDIDKHLENKGLLTEQYPAQASNRGRCNP